MSSANMANKKVIGLVSGNGSGKTSLAECLLFNSGATNRLGKIESKNIAYDYRKRGNRSGSY